VTGRFKFFLGVVVGIFLDSRMMLKSIAHTQPLRIVCNPNKISTILAIAKLPVYYENAQRYALDNLSTRWQQHRVGARGNDTQALSGSLFGVHHESDKRA